jgi:hypothetical protein
VAFTATVTSTVGVPDGTVTFSDGATTLGTVALDATGKASLTPPALPVGTHPITATYVGSTNFATSTAVAFPEVVNKSDTSVVLASSANPSLISTNVDFRATVTATAPGGGIPSGTVTFTEGPAVLGTATLDATGVAIFSTAALTQGPHSISAHYDGSGNYNASASAALAQKVNIEAAVVALTSAPSPSTYGAKVVFTATVTGGVGVPVGTVTFKELLGASGSTTIGSASLDATGAASISTSALAAGSHAIVADYSGDTVYAVGSGTVSHVVGKATTTTTLVTSENPSTVGPSVTFTAAVSSDATGFTGKVDFLDGTTVLGTASLTGASTTFTARDLPKGTHAITASYSGDVNFAGSTSSPLTQTVGDATASATDGGVAPIDAGITVSPPPGDDGSCSAAPRPARDGWNGGRSELAFVLAGMAFALRQRRRRKSGGRSLDA